MAGRLGLGGCHEGQVLDHLLGVLCLASAGLSGAEDALVLTVCNKVVSPASSSAINTISDIASRLMRTLTFLSRV